jgi:hypothetical protein
LTTPDDWIRCKAWVEEAVKRSAFYNLDYVEAECAAGRMVFWAGKHCAALTNFIDYPNGKALNVFAGGGDSHEALDEFVTRVEPDLVVWAKASGCRWIIGHGRPGWERVCKKMGYRHAWTVMSKEIQ